VRYSVCGRAKQVRDITITGSLAARMSESRLTPGVIYRAVLLAFGLVVAGLIFRALATLILGVLIVIVIALPLAAFTSMLERRGIPRAVSAPLGLLLVLGALGGLIAAIVPVFTHEVNQFVNSLPSTVDSLGHRLGRLTGGNTGHAGQQLKQFIAGYTHHPTKLLGPLESIGASVVAALAAIVVVLLTAVYTAIKPDPLSSGLIRLVPPAGRPTATHIVERLRTAYIGWLRGLAIGMLILGGVTYLGLRLTGIPFAAFFAVFTAVAMIVPYFGALVSSIPPILFALTISPGKALIVAGIYIAAHQLEGNVIQPLVVARTVEMHPAIVAVGVVAVDQLFGFVGLIVAVPILVTIKILVEELWISRWEEAGVTWRRPRAATARGGRDASAA
jgi:predicted PurR-regulated permease PerM